MAYKYETHLHTSDSSACGRSCGPDYLAGYKELDYDGIFVTDHFYLGNTCIPRDLPWEKWVDRYCQSYYKTKEAGDQEGLKVFFGWESTYGTGEDFLIYGLSPKWLKGHPEIISLNQEEQYNLVHKEGGLVVQAHPFRERGYMSEIQLHPNHCDAWEIANAGNMPYMDKRAYEYAKAHGMRMTCGSDIHTTDKLKADMVFPMITDEPLNSEHDYVHLILSGKGFHPEIPQDIFDCELQEPGLPVYWHF